MRKFGLLLATLGVAGSLDAQEPSRIPTAPGIEIFVEAFGSGPDTLILVHGTPASMYSLAPDFAQLGERFTVVAYDQRGGGRSTPVTDPSELGWERHVEDLEALRRHFGLARLNLIGISWGSALVALYADRHPDNVGRLILFPMRVARGLEVPNGFQRVQNLSPAEVERMTDLQRQWEEATDVLSLCQEFWSLASRNMFADPTLAPRMQASFCAEPASVLRNTWKVSAAKMSSLGDFDFRPILKRIEAPALVIKGTASGIPRSWVEGWAEALPHGEMLWVEDAGVAVWVERPDIVMAAIREFF